jgi:SAM-dependent methyltransferase
MFFDNYPEFITNDSRSKRGISTVTSESLTKRHEVSLPKNLISECSVLDLGSCYGATGHWCLANGASHYTGVEIQKDMVDKSNQMLSKYWNNYNIIELGIDDFLKQNTNHYDVTILFGVLYAFLDQHGLLEQVCAITNKVVVIDTLYPRKMVRSSDAIIEVLQKQHINSSKENTAYVGVGSATSPMALNIIMDTLGFENTEGLLYPNCSDTTVPDSYNTIVGRGENSGDFKLYTQFPLRYICRFTKGNSSYKIVSDIVKNNDVTLSTSMRKPPKVLWNKHWVFDSSVADRYEQEVNNHIPDYDRVIDMCIDCIDVNFNKDVKIIDVGSAKGNTMDKLLSHGYSNVYGVEASEAMYSSSKHKDKVIMSDTFPEGDWDVVLANWTLHFINEREQYLKDIYDNMSHNGMLILSDKMAFTEDIESLYHNFKRSHGVTEDEINSKKQSLIGVLNTKSFMWYLNTLEKIGFRDIQIINANMMFNTLYARK